MTNSSPARWNAQTDTALALQSASATQQAIGHADAKLGVLAAIDGGLLAAVLSETPPWTLAWHAASWSTVAAGLSGVLVIVTAALSAAYLCAGFWPRLYGRGPESRLAFPALAGDSSVPSIPPRRARDEAWLVAIALADIADRKFKCVRSAIIWTALSAGAAAVWLASTPTSLSYAFLAFYHR